MKQAALFVGLLLNLALSAVAQTSPTLTVVNQAGDGATVRVVGPTSGYLEVAAGASRTVAVSGGVYTLKVRYCNASGNCRYSETSSFTISQSAYSVDEITVTLHSSGGNLNERSISASDFNGTN
jgi:hypothetical protein